MKLDRLTKKAFKVLNTVVPSLSPEKLLDTLKDYFNPNLSRAENKRIMMQKIREGKLGKALADVVSDEFITNKSFEEVLEMAEEEYNLKTQKIEQKNKQKIEQKTKQVIEQENIQEDYLYNVHRSKNLNYL